MLRGDQRDPQPFRQPMPIAFCLLKASKLLRAIAAPASEVTALPVELYNAGHNEVIHPQEGHDELNRPHMAAPAQEMADDG